MRKPVSSVAMPCDLACLMACSQLLFSSFAPRTSSPIIALQGTRCKRLLVRAYSLCGMIANNFCVRRSSHVQPVEALRGAHCDGATEQPPGAWLAWLPLPLLSGGTSCVQPAPAFQGTRCLRGTAAEAWLPGPCFLLHMHSFCVTIPSGLSGACSYASSYVRLLSLYM